MRKFIWSAIGIVVAFLTLAIARPALAADGSQHLESKCATVADWYVNSDETDRQPTVTAGGLVFEDNQLVHHATTLDVSDLKHGTYVASDVPSQPSFFSVEVFGSDGKYGTLRWNTDTSKWEVSTKDGYWTDENAVKLVDTATSGGGHLSHHVVSFGVGYTNNPRDGVKTRVSSVTFGTTEAGSPRVFDLTCTPPTETTPPTTQPTTKAPTSHATTAPGAGGTGGKGSTGSGALAITGPSTWVMGGVAAVLLLGGGGIVYASRRRRSKFVA